MKEKCENDQEEFTRNIGQDINTEEVMSHRFFPKRCKGKNSLPAFSPQPKQHSRVGCIFFDFFLEHDLAIVKFSVERDVSSHHSSSLKKQLPSIVSFQYFFKGFTSNCFEISCSIRSGLKENKNTFAQFRWRNSSQQQKGRGGTTCRWFCQKTVK